MLGGALLIAARPVALPHKPGLEAGRQVSR